MDFTADYFLIYNHGQQSRLILEGFGIWTKSENGVSILDTLIREWPVEQVLMLAEDVDLRLDAAMFDTLVFKYGEDLDEADEICDLTDCVDLLGKIMDKIPDIPEYKREEYLRDIYKFRQQIKYLEDS